MPINHDMMHAHSPDELERENATLKEMVAKAQGRIAELEAENKKLKDDVRYLREENLTLKEDLLEKEL